MQRTIILLVKDPQRTAVLALYFKARGDLVYHPSTLAEALKLVSYGSTTIIAELSSEDRALLIDAVAGLDVELLIVKDLFHHSDPTFQSATAVSRLGNRSAEVIAARN